MEKKEPKTIDGKIRKGESGKGNKNEPTIEKKPPVTEARSYIRKKKKGN